MENPTKCLTLNLTISQISQTQYTSGSITLFRDIGHLLKMMYDAVHVVLQAMVVYLLQRPENATVTLQTAAQKEDINIRKALI